ncbi:MAG: MFS transporter [Candidatus Gastranaerophilaceae bacterium]
MLSSVLGFFKEPPAKEVIGDENEVKKSYAHWRLRIFYSCFIGYTIFYLCKKNIAVALPGLSTEFGYSNTELGLLGSSLYLTYGIGKFINGVFADSSDVRKFLPTALALSAIANICFALSAVFITPGHASFFGLPSGTVLLWLFAFFWGANGWFQSAGFPAIAKSLTYWYSNSERGTKWSLWSCSHQVGTFLSVIVSGFIVARYGWRMAFFVPAILALLAAFWLFNRLRDKPQSLGLPCVESFRDEPIKNKGEEDQDNRSYGQIFKENILFNKTIWLLAIAYIFVYIIRFGAEDWMVKYLSEFKHNSLELAAMKLSTLPLFGIVGTIMAGVISDKIFKGQRAPVNLIYLTGVVICLVLLKINTISNLDFVLIGLIGAFTYGPQMMIGGLCAVESSSKKVASAATGFTGSFGYLGAIFSATGTGFVVDKFGWGGAIWYWCLSAIICIVICIVLFFDERKSCRKTMCENIEE